MRILGTLFVLSAVALLGAAGAEEPPAPSVESVAFIAGTWHGELFGGEADESWMPPRAGTMLGSFRLTWPESGKRLYEFLIIEEAENGEVVMNFRHFGPRMELWKNEVEAPLSFVLVEAGPGRAVFEAPDRAQKPARFIFESDETGRSLTIVVESLDAGGETEDSFTAEYTRRKAP
jgi:hypothetical protein